jgi:hypothetical protein
MGLLVDCFAMSGDINGKVRRRTIEALFEAKEKEGIRALDGED